MDFFSFLFLVGHNGAIHTLTHLNPYADPFPWMGSKNKSWFSCFTSPNREFIDPIFVLFFANCFRFFPSCKPRVLYAKAIRVETTLFVRFRMQFDSLQVLNNRLIVVRCFRPPPLSWFASLLLVIITVLARCKCAGCFSSHFPCGFDYWVEWPQ